MVRASAPINPMVRRACNSRGEEPRETRGRRLKAWAVATDERVEPDVTWGTGAKAMERRIVAHWNAEEGRYTWLVTNLSRARMTGEQVGQVYRLRWQVELLFKEWQSYANLHAFDTKNASIAQGLIQTAVAASVLKRSPGRMTQVLRGVEVSTRKVAMCARHGLGDVFRVLASGRRRGLVRALRVLVDYLAHNATRVHPERDRKKGRLQLGLEPVFASAQVPAYEDALGEPVQCVDTPRNVGYTANVTEFTDISTSRWLCAIRAAFELAHVGLAGRLRASIAAVNRWEGGSFASQETVGLELELEEK